MTEKELCGSVIDETKLLTKRRHERDRLYALAMHPSSTNIGLLLKHAEIQSLLSQRGQFLDGTNVGHTHVTHGGMSSGKGNEGESVGRNGRVWVTLTRLQNWTKM